MRKYVIAAVGTAVAGLAVWYALHSSGVANRSGLSATIHAGSERLAPGVERAPSARAHALATQSSSLPVHSAPRDSRLGDRLRHADDMRRQIAELSRNRASPAPPIPTPQPPSMPAAEGDGNQVGKPLGKYVDNLLKQQFQPVAEACYDELLSRSPSAAGSLVLNVKVVGDASVGGVIEEVEIAPESTLDDSELRLCLRESMFAMAFDAPPGGAGELTFSYPLQLSPEPAGRQDQVTNR